MPARGRRFFALVATLGRDQNHHRVVSLYWRRPTATANTATTDRQSSTTTILSNGTGGGQEEETAADLADKILQAIGTLHSGPGGAAKVGEEGGCALCRGGDGGVYGGGGGGGACGGDDALAMSSGLGFVARGSKEEFTGGE